MTKNKHIALFEFYCAEFFRMKDLGWQKVCSDGICMVVDGDDHAARTLLTQVQKELKSRSIFTDQQLREHLNDDSKAVPEPTGIKTEPLVRAHNGRLARVY